MRLDRLGEQHAEHGGRQEADAHVDGETLCARIAAQAGDGFAQTLRIDEHHREDRAGLDRDVEHLALLVGEAEQRSGEDQMSGRRDWQEFGQPLDDAHEGGLDEQQRVQARELRRDEDAG